MSKIDKKDIEELLEKWYKTKLELALLEKKCDKYKKYCEKIMNNLDKNNIVTDNYNIKRIHITRETLGKKDVPEEIWKKYSNKNSFPVYYLKQNKNK